jgi:hypothetical protein
MHLADDVERLLHSRRVSGLPEHFILPHYSGYSIANLAPTVAQLLGVTLEGKTPSLPEHLRTDLADDVACVVLLILDAAGYRPFRHYLDAEHSIFSYLSSEGRLVPITSVFPSTTVSALTSIWTGQPPLGHGFLGTKLLLPEQGVLANMLKMAPAVHTRGGRLEDWGWDPESFVTAPSLGGQLHAAGVDSVAHTRLSFIGSSLTNIFLRGMGKVHGYVGLSDLWLNLRRTLTERQAGQRLFVDAYWASIDSVGHVYGPTGAYLPSALRHLARSFEEDFLARLPKEAREDTLLIVTADHGQIATPPERVVHLPEHPTLQETLLLPPAGESRAAYLYAKPGQKDALQGYVEEHLAEHFVLQETERALETGLFGPTKALSPHLRARLGDMLLIAKDDARLTRRAREKEGGTSLRGHHGSLTPEEMLVPLLMVRLDQL